MVLLTGGGFENATGVRVNSDGTIALFGSSLAVPVEGGVAIASGTLSTASTGTGEKPGTIAVLGDKVGLIGANIDASGATGGGTVLIGGDYQGKGSIPTALFTFISPDSTISADALNRGSGGRVIVWADGTTKFYGSVTARGSGNASSVNACQNLCGAGGFVEISGKENLIFRGTVDLSAPNGSTGTLLLDPENITIVSGSGGAFDTEVSDSQILFGEGTGTFTISETTLESLDGNADVKLEASNDITVSDLSDNELSFTAGIGSITFTADADGNGSGSFFMASDDTIRAEGRNVTINAAAITAGNIDTSSATSNGGAISLNATGDIVTGTLRSPASGSSGNGGAIAITSSNGAVNTTSGVLLSDSASGDGGSVTLTASGDINTNYIGSSSQGSGKGGNIALNSSNGAVTATSGGLESYSASGDGGSVTLTASKDINADYISSSSYGSGKGGNIALNSSNGSVNTSSSVLSSSSYSGDSGSIALTASGDIHTGYIHSYSNGSGRGGNITITSSSGAVTATSGEIESYSSAGDGGSVTLTASGDINAGNINSYSYGTGTGGAIALNSTAATLNTVGFTLNSSSSSGTAGNITLTAAGLVSAGDVSSSGGFSGGNVTLRSTYSNVDTSSGTIDVSSTSGTAGNIAIAAYSGSIAVGNISGSKNISIAAGGTDNPLSTDADASSISDADKINNLSGSISLQAHNDITVSEPISTSSISSLELRAGRSININADIHTSGGNGNITLRANDNGADITRRDAGAGNITMAPGTSLNSGSGNITLELGTLATVGNITLGNLNTTGTVNVNAMGGNVLRSSDTSLITAGAGIFQTTGTGSLGLPEQPLQINLTNLEVTAGSGGAFFDSPSRGVTLGGASSFLKGISTFGGGNFTLSASGDIVVTEDINTSHNLNAGQIALTSLAGAIDTTTSPILSYSNEGNSGSITLAASGNISTGNIRSYSNGSGSGGNIVINSSSGAVNTTSGRLDSYSSSGNGGSVIFTAYGDINTGDIHSSSQGSGKGGNIALNSSNGAVNTSNGDLSSFSIDGDGGSVELTARGDINTGSIGSFAYGSGRGGDIALNSSNGAVNGSSGGLNSYSSSGNGGSVTLTAYGDIKIGNIYSASNGSGMGGNIALNSSSGAVNTTYGYLSSYSQAGNGGSVTLTAYGDINTGNIRSSSDGSGAGGNIAINSSSGNITSGNNNASGGGQNSLESFSESGTAGDVTLSAIGNVNVAGIRSDGDLHGGNINITAGGAIDATAGNIDSYSSAGTGGDVTLSASSNVTANNIATYGNLKSGHVTIRSGNGAITTAAITTTASNGTSGNITLNTFSTTGNITTADITSSGSSGAGNITADSAGNVTTGDVSSESSEASSGDTTVSAGGNATTGNVSSSGNTGAGDATVTSGGNANTGDVESTASSGTAGDSRVSAIGNATTGNVSSSGNTGAGDATVTSGGNANTGNVQSISQQGSAGNATVSAVGDVSAGNVSSIGNTGAGNVTVTSSSASVTAGNLESISNSGFSGDVTVAAMGDVITGNILSEGQAGSGDISVTSTAGGITTGNIASISQLGNSGDIALDALNNITTGDISSIAGLSSGDITVTSQEGAIDTGDISSIALNGTAGDITLSAKNGINTGDLISQGTLGNGRITLNNQTGNIKTGQIATDLEKVTIHNPSGSVTVDGMARSELTNPQLTNQPVLQSLILPNMAVTIAIATDAQIQQIEAARVQEFSDYFGEDMPAKPVTVQSIRNALADIAKITGTHSAIAYINALPDQLELVLFTAEGQPIRKTLPGIKREEVLRTVRALRDRITTPSQRSFNTYLKPSQQLYQWLISPIQEELTANRIDTVLFSLDAGLRGLPVAALHDGKQFLVEKYSLALIPSISLMDTTYQSLEGSRVLAMGASDFKNLNPLPAVPVELAQITQQREGRAFLNEDFTRGNIMGQRSNSLYPILHLATHGEFSAGDVKNSYIQLWDEKLRLNQLRALRLNNPQVELLVLSACKTAVGDEKAELGFAGFAVAAGVKSAVASLWYVSDEGTLALMSQFYNHLNNAKIKGDALRQAQLAMLRGDVQVKDGQLQGTGIRGGSLALPKELANVANTNLSHPYYWSAFTMIGSPW